MPNIAFNTDYQKQVEIRNELVTLKLAQNEVLKHGTCEILAEIIKAKEESLARP